MEVDISNAVLIFDEAHNIEDNAREAASAEASFISAPPLLLAKANSNQAIPSSQA